MRIVKRFICLVFILLFAVLATFSVCADNVTHYIPELKMSLDIPDYMTVNTRATNPKMTEGIYLEATCQAPDLDIRVLMQKDKKTEEFFNLSLLSSSALEEYKDALLENPQYSDCTEGEYGGVLFLDFSTYDTVGDAYIYGRQSITVVNGMSIVIMSTSDGDALTSDEISLIRNVVSSVKFDEILKKSSAVTFWTIFIPVILVIIVLAVLFIVLSYFMKKKNIEAKKRRKLEQERKADYDVLKRAEKKASNSMGLGGYKTSEAFFEDAFSREVASTNNKSAQAVTGNRNKKSQKKAKYFFANLKGEISKNKSKKKNAGRKPAKKQKPVAKDYDIFSE